MSLALEKAGPKLSDVVTMTVFITDMQTPVKGRDEENGRGRSPGHPGDPRPGHGHGR